VQGFANHHRDGCGLVVLGRDKLLQQPYDLGGEQGIERTLAFACRQVDHAVRDDQVHAGVRAGDRLQLTVDRLHVAEAGLARGGSGALEHLGQEVERDHPPGGPGSCGLLDITPS